MTVFRPSVVIGLTLTFDPALTLLPEPYAESPEERAANNAFPAPQPTKPPEYLILAGTVNDKGQRINPHSSFIGYHIPKSASWEMPGYRQAATFHCTLNWTDLPIDPRTVKAAAVTIHCGSVSDDDAALASSAVNGRRADGSLPLVLNPTDDNMHMMGMVDEWKMELNNGSAEITLSGRDMRGMLLDTPIGVLPNSGVQILDEIDLGQPIDEVILQLLGYAGSLFAGFKVVANPAEWPNGVVNSPGGVNVPRHRKGAKKTKAPKGMASGSVDNLNFWDIIVKYCFLSGAVPILRNTTIYVRPSRTAYDQMIEDIDPVKNPTPFLGKRVRDFDKITNTAINPGLRVRRLVYGRDVEKLSFDRKLAGHQKPRVVRVGPVYDADAPLDPVTNERHVMGLYPVNAQEQHEVNVHTAGGDSAQMEVITIPPDKVAPIRDKKQLDIIAQSVFEELSRGEMGGTVETKNLSSFGGDNSDPDLLRLRPGDGVELMTDTRSVRTGSAPLVSSYTNFNRVSFSEAVQNLKKKINDEDLCRVIVATARGQVAELQRFFRVQTVKYSWSTSGISLSFDFQNYVVSKLQYTQAPNTQAKAVSKQVPAKPSKSKQTINTGKSVMKPGWTGK